MSNDTSDRAHLNVLLVTRVTLGPSLTPMRTSGTDWTWPDYNTNQLQAPWLHAATQSGVYPNANWLFDAWKVYTS